MRLEVCVWSHATEAKAKDPVQVVTNGRGSECGTPLSPLYTLFHQSSIALSRGRREKREALSYEEKIRDGRSGRLRRS